MVDGIAGGGLGRIDAARAQAAQRSSATRTPAAAKPIAVDGAEETTASRLAQGGPPVDSEKVAAIRIAIAEGRYPVDPEKIAQKMIDLDLGMLA